MSLPPASSASSSASSALYSQFQLLPPPSRRPLSRTPEDLRCRLPDFTLSDDPVAALREWARREFFFDLHPGWVHVYVGTACIGALIIIAGCILLLRIYARTFWIARCEWAYSLSPSHRIVALFLLSATPNLQLTLTSPWPPSRLQCLDGRTAASSFPTRSLAGRWVAEPLACEHARDPTLLHHHLLLLLLDRY